MIQAIGLTSVPRRHQPPAVDDLTFEACPGEITVLWGPAGAGKTTALRLMLHLSPGRGVGLFRGRPLPRVPHPLQEVGVLLGDVPGHPARTARNHLRMLAAAVGVPVDRVEDLLATVGLADVADHRLGGFSLGMSRRLGLAVALLGDPHTLVLDEPTEGLSAREVSWMAGLLTSYTAEGGTVLVATRKVAVARELADRVVTMEAGRLLADEEVTDFVRAQRRPRVTVHSPQAERLAALLSHQAGVSSQPGNSVPLEVVPEGGGRIAIYGSTCASVGETAHRHGILVHQLTFEEEQLHASSDLTDGAVGRTGGAPPHGATPGAPSMGTPGVDCLAPAPLGEAPRSSPPGGASGVHGNAAPRSVALASQVLADQEARSAHAQSEGARTVGHQVNGVEADRRQELPARQEAQPPRSGRRTRVPRAGVPAIAADHTERGGPEEAGPLVAHGAGLAEGTAVTGVADAEGGSDTPDTVNGSHTVAGETGHGGLRPSSTPGAQAADRGHAGSGVTGLDALPGTGRGEEADRPEASAVLCASEYVGQLDTACPADYPAPEPGATIVPVTTGTPGATVPFTSPTGPTVDGLLCTSAGSLVIRSAPSAPPAETNGAARSSFRIPTIRPTGPSHPLRYELLRFATLRSSWLTPLLALLAGFGTAVVLAPGGDPTVGRLLSGWPVSLPLPPVALAAGVLGAVAFGQEFRYPVLAPARTSSPRRLGLLVAKLTLSGVVAVALVLATVVVNASVGMLFSGGDRTGVLRPPSGLWVTVAGLVVLCLCCAWGGLLAAGAFRSTMAGLAAAVAVPMVGAPALWGALWQTPGAEVPAWLWANALASWPAGLGPGWSGMTEFSGQPVGCAVLLSLIALLACSTCLACRYRTR